MPYRPNTSAKMMMTIIPTYILGCTAEALTPASPTIPIANPADMPHIPTDNPAPNCRNDVARGVKRMFERPEDIMTETTSP